MVLDIHAHLYPPAFLERLTETDLGPMALTRDGDDFVFTVGGQHFVTFTPAFYDADLRVEAMDAHGVDTQGLTLAPPMVFWADPDLALELCQLTNDHLADVAARHPGRFVPGAVVPLQQPDLAVDELRRAVDDLGHRMVLMGSNIHGTQLDDPSLAPFYAAVEELDIPVYVHPIKPAGVECMHDYRLDISVGFPTDTTLAATRVVLSGLLDRHPGLRFCWAHLGGCLPWLVDRIEMVRGRIPRADDHIDGPVADYVARYWFDTTVPTHRNLRYGVELAGVERLLFGTDVPFFDDLTPELLDVVRTAPFLDAEQRDAILGGNAEAFLGL